MRTIKLLSVAALVLLGGLALFAFSPKAYADSLPKEASSTEEYIVETSPGEGESAAKRIVVLKELDSLYGAEKAVTYDGETLLTYGTKEAAETGFAALCEEHGKENVFCDEPIFIEAKGWGTAYMCLDKKSNTVSSNGKSVTIAVIDSGINRNHEIFSGKTITGRNFLTGGSNYTDNYGHGTKVAGLIAESTPKNVRLMILKVMGNNGEGSAITCAQAIRYAAEKGADVINCSLGAEMVLSTDLDKYLDKYLKTAESKGAIIVAAAGNTGSNLDNTTYYPAESPYVMCVGAIDANEKRCGFSNFGKSLDFCAPGKNLFTAGLSKDNYTSSSGTSFSTAYIAASIALLRAENPGLSRQKAIKKLAETSKDLGEKGKDSFYGYGVPVFAGNSSAEEAKKPGTPTIKVKWKKTKKRYRARAVWKRTDGAAGYQMQIVSKKKKRGGVKYAKTVKTTKASYTFPKKYTKKQKKNSKVKIRIRAYNGWGYGPWSRYVTLR